MNNSRATTREVGALIIGAAILVALRLRFGTLNIGDDAWMTLVVARNFSLGLGLVYNAGERVLATSAPLYAVLLGSLGFVLGPNNIPQIAIAVNVCSDLAAYWVLYAWLGAASGSRRLALVCALLFALSQRVIEYSSGAKDSALFVLLIVSAFYALEKERRDCLGVLLGLTAVFRPEGALLSAAVLPVMMLRRLRPWRTALIAAATALPVIAALAWYYGTPVPNTVISKWHIPLLPTRFYTLLKFLAQPALSFYGAPVLRLSTMLAGAHSSVTAAAVLFILCVLQIGPCAWAAARISRASDGVLAASFFVPIYIAAFVIGGAWEFGWYRVPLEPLWNSGVVAAWWLMLGGDHQPRLMGFVFALLIALQAVHSVVAKKIPTLLGGDMSRERAMERVCSVVSARGLARTDTVLSQIPGIPGWHLQARIVDTWGQIYPGAIRHHMGAYTGLGSYWYVVPTSLVLDLRPRYFIAPNIMIESSCLRDPRFLKEYALVDSGEFTGPGHSLRLNVYERRNSQAP